MEHFIYKTKNTCSKQIDFDVDNNKLYNLKFTGGCPGNLALLSKILEGRDLTEILDLIGHVECGTRGTSCSIQLGEAIKEVLSK